MGWFARHCPEFQQKWSEWFPWAMKFLQIFQLQNAERLVDVQALFALLFKQLAMHGTLWQRNEPKAAEKSACLCFSNGRPATSLTAVTSSVARVLSSCRTVHMVQISDAEAPKWGSSSDAKIMLNTVGLHVTRTALLSIGVSLSFAAVALWSVFTNFPVAHKRDPTSQNQVNFYSRTKSSD